MLIKLIMYPDAFSPSASLFQKQILTQYADITSVEFPAVFERFLSYVDLVNLDLGWVLSATCLVDVNFYGRLLFTTLAPLALLCVLGCTYLVARYVLGEGVNDDHV